jgi:signal peptide peptidase SppA, 36K type
MEAVAPKVQVGHLTVSGVITDSSFYVKQIRSFLKNPAIKGLLVKIDCSGGAAGSSQAIFSELKKFREKKPVVAFIENIGTSGAYNVAVASSYIVASPSALVGSIGVWLTVPPDIKDLAANWKIKFRNIQSGEFKTAGSPFKEMTPEEKAHLQEVCDNSYHQFVNDIAQSRNLSAKNHKVWADGKVFTGNQALQLKLVDKLGSELDAIDELKKQALIGKDEEIQFVHPRRPSRIMQLLSGDDDAEIETNLSSVTADFITDVATKVSSKCGISTGM